VYKDAEEAGMFAEASLRGAAPEAPAGSAGVRAHPPRDRKMLRSGRGENSLAPIAFSGAHRTYLDLFSV
jgi:hypothetical protein